MPLFCPPQLFTHRAAEAVNSEELKRIGHHLPSESGEAHASLSRPHSCTVTDVATVKGSGLDWAPESSKV